MQVRPLAPDDLERVLPLVAAYQRFYGAADIDAERNRAFFGRFVPAGEQGVLLGAFAAYGELVGFACVYWTLSSVQAREMALMNDLFVTEAARGTGVGRALIDAAAAASRERGMHRLRWMTALDNRRAQALYERTGAERSTWFEYELSL
ncbi:MAG TPA: GNAT family N-acetyltransferase [Solirubrobacteraceae bacterium]|nr:GNAT family N-acetyltransferase [Solirubrobacteraceae bacterium]